MLADEEPAGDLAVRFGEVILRQPKLGGYTLAATRSQLRAYVSRGNKGVTTVTKLSCLKLLT